MIQLTFGERLRAARKQKKLTQKELAKLINAAHNSISNWENDQNKPDPDTIQNLCWALDVQPNYFFGETSKPDPLPAPRITEDVESEKISPEAKEIAKAFDKATPKEQNLVRLTLSEYLDDNEYQLAAARGNSAVRIPLQTGLDDFPENDTNVDG